MNMAQIPVNMTPAERALMARVVRRDLTLQAGYGLQNDDQQTMFHNFVTDALGLLKVIPFETKTQKKGTDDSYIDTTGAATYRTAKGAFGGGVSTTATDGGAAFDCQDASTSLNFTKAQREGNVMAKGKVIFGPYYQGAAPDADDFAQWVHEGPLAMTVANNNEDILINGTKSSDPSGSAREEMLSVQDGLITKTASFGHQTDGLHLVASIKMLEDLFTSIEPGWKQNKANMRFLVPELVDSQLRMQIGAQTATNYTPLVARQNGVLAYRDIELLVVPLWPIDLTSTSGTTSYTDESRVMLTPIDNLKWVMSIQGHPPYITRWYENPGTMELVVYLHRDIDIFAINPKAFACAYNVATSGSLYGA